MCTFVCIMGGRGDEDKKWGEVERYVHVCVCVIRVYYGGEIKIKMGGGGGVCTFVCIMGGR